MIKTTFKTQRTILVPFDQNEVELFHWLNIDPFIRKFLWDDEIITKAQAKEILELNNKHFSENNYGLWKVVHKSTDEVIGYTGLWYFFDEPQPQLIYAILERYTGLGLATECALQVLNYALEDLKFDYLIAATDETHHESQKVAKRLGMHFAEKRIEADKPTLFYRINRRQT